jgi:hypothetical protein
VDNDREALPDDIEALKAALIAARAEVAAARAQRSDDQALIAHLKLEIAKLNRHRYGPHAERTARLVDQMELQLEELKASATADEIAAEMAAAKARVNVAPFTRHRPARKPFPDYLPRERVIVLAPAACPCCGGTRLSKLGEDVTETLEVIPRQCWGGRPPNGIVCARMRSLQISNKGDRPWNRLAELGWIRRNTFSRFTGWIPPRRRFCARSFGARR